MKVQTHQYLREGAVSVMKTMIAEEEGRGERSRILLGIPLNACHDVRGSRIEDAHLVESVWMLVNCRVLSDLLNQVDWSGVVAGMMLITCQADK